MTAGPTKLQSLRPHRWVGLIVWTALVAAVGWWWHRSLTVSDALVMYTPAGHVQGVLSHRGHLVVAVSSIELRGKGGWRFEKVWASSDEADWLFHAATSDAPNYRPWLFGFAFAEGKKGPAQAMPGANWTAVVFPHAAALGLLALGWCRHVWRFTLRRRDRRRVQRGECLACGYDLRGLAGTVCPECGAPAAK